MKTISLSDGGHTYQLRIREDVELPPLPTREEPAHMRFISWWRSECRKMGISYSWTVSEPQGIRIIQSLLKKHDLNELQKLARHFFLDHGDRLRSDPRHFSIFSSLLETMRQELKRE